MIVGKCANFVDVNPNIKNSHQTQYRDFSSFRWVSLTSKESDWKRGKVFYPLMLMAYEKIFSFIRIELKFVGRHPLLNRDEALL